MLTDDAVRRLVMQQPIPDRLIRALARAPLLPDLTPTQVSLCRRWGVPSADPDDLTPSLRRTLLLTCHGLTTQEVADVTGFAFHTVTDHRKVLRAVFRARNAAHMGALAVAQGYVDMAEALR